MAETDIKQPLPICPTTSSPPPPPPPPREKRKRGHGWLWALLILILLVILAIIWFRKPKKKSAPPPPVAISTTNVQLGEMPVTVTALGSVTAVYTAGISPRVDGQLLQVNYTEGQMVKTNDLLALIDPGPFEATELQAEGTLARDQAALEIARIDLKRYQEAFLRKAVPQQQVVDQQALVHQNEGTVKFDEGVLQSARVNLAYCYIRAPFSGRVGLRLIDPGNIVHAANTNALVVITEIQPITVIFNVAEDFLPQILEQVRQDHTMTVEAYDRTGSQKLATGKYLTTDNLIDQATGTIRIRAQFENEDLELFPNQFVNARLIIEVLTNQTLVPTFAVQRNPQGAFLYVLTNQLANEVVTNNRVVVTNQVTNTVVVMRNIKVGVTDTNLSSVEGVSPNEIIATDNFNKLGEGTKVTPKQPGERDTNPGAPNHEARPTRGKTNK